MKQFACWKKAVLTTALTVALLGVAAQSRAADLPLAATSPMTGVAFDDKPLQLPVQRNFQMAMLTAGSELGRSCGQIEAYGWRMSQTEQGRVNQIFNNTVDRLRLQGYSIAPQALTSVSNDITLFTADRTDKHFMFLWSAGELGLVMNVCETSAPLPPAARAQQPTSSVQVFPVATDAVSSHIGTLGKTEANGAGGFTPLGEWVGGYTCAQGYTGGTLQIDHIHGQDFDGVFKFYPTPKNPDVPAGSYNVYGQYDEISKRILINPGKWINRPKDFYDTVIVGVFDPANDVFSAYFQGISGCTSFEARHMSVPQTQVALKKKPVKKHATKKKHIVKKVAAPLVTTPVGLPITAPADTSSGMVPVVPAITMPATAPAAPVLTDVAPAAVPQASAPAAVQEAPVPIQTPALVAPEAAVAPTQGSSLPPSGK